MSFCWVLNVNNLNSIIVVDVGGVEELELSINSMISSAYMLVNGISFGHFVRKCHQAISII